MTHDRQLSRRLSYLLRHRPDAAGLRLDPQGWADVDAVLAALGVERAALEAVVRDNDKQRFALDGDRIRAQQGHSVRIDLGLAPQRPPGELWHGTSARAVDAVLREGLVPGRRTHVHLSADPDTARRVGARHGVPVVLRVDAAGAWADGVRFLLSGNGVWLVESLPARYLERG